MSRQIFLCYIFKVLYKQKDSNYMVGQRVQIEKSSLERWNPR